MRKSKNSTSSLATEKYISVGIIEHQKEPLSFQNYRKNILKYLPDYIKPSIVSLNKISSCQCDLLWHPGLGGALRIPEAIMTARLPIVVTMHGTVPFSTPLEELNDKPEGRKKIELNRDYVTKDWNEFKSQVNSVIAVSHYSKGELHKHLHIPQSIIHVVHHGVDHDIFNPAIKRKRSNYFIHVSTGVPRKNLNRILCAYDQLQLEQKPELILVGIKRLKSSLPIGVSQLSPISAPELAELYRNALALVFPSIEESFGMPIIEAMACGCPVITSNNTGCREVSSPAGLLVNPFNIDEIQQAMHTLASDSTLHHQQQRLSLAHAQTFKWQVAANQHAKLFANLLKQRQSIIE